MSLPVLLAAAAFLACAVAVPALRPLAFRLGWVDVPGDPALKVHARPIPLVGGAAILAGVAATLVPTLWTRDVDVKISSLWLAALTVSLVGLVDDRRPLGPGLRLALEAVASLAFAWQAFGGSHSGSELAWLAAASALYLVVALNAFNLQDGIDGLAGSLALVSLAGCATLASIRHEEGLLWTAAALAGAVAAFLLYNWPPASIFMGDGGSYLLGFSIGAMSLLLTVGSAPVQRAAAAPLLLGLPLLDAGSSLVRRLARGASPFAGDRGHLYDRLAARGLPLWQVTLLCTAIHGCCVLAGVLLLT